MEQFILTLIRRWFWLVGLATLVAGVTTYWIIEQQPAVYEAKARLLVGPGLDSLNPDLNALRTSAQLMQTYAELSGTWPFLQTIIDDLDLDTNPLQLKDNIRVLVNEETQILAINVRAGAPVLAVTIANAVTDGLIRSSPSSRDNPQSKLKEQIRNQAKKLEANIAATETIIKQLEADFQATTDIVEQRQFRDQIAEERRRLIDTHNILARLYDSLQQSSVNQIKIIEPAVIVEQVSSQMQLKVLAGSMSSFVLSVVIILIFEYLNNTIRTSPELTQMTDIPFLGNIAKHKTLSGVGQERLVVLALPESQAAERYRMLGAKFLPKVSSPMPMDGDLPPSNGRPVHSFLITNVEITRDTGAEFAANLAVVLTQAGYRVALVDANWHRPTIDQLTGLTGRDGLSSLLTDQSKTPELISVDWAPGLCLLPSGPIPSNPLKLLASPQMTNLIEALKNQVDFVLIAAPPLLAVADSLILASRVDDIIIVVPSGQTRRHRLKYAIESLQAHSANIFGLVLDHNRSNLFSLFSRRMAGLTPTTKVQSSDKGVPGQVFLSPK